MVLATELTTAYQLLGRRPWRPVRLRPAPSAVVLHMGTRRSWPEIAHHTISFGQAWQQTFTEIIDDGKLMHDPSLLVTRPTATDPGLAPDGTDLLYILAPAPNLDRGPDRLGPDRVRLRRRAGRHRRGPAAARAGDRGQRARCGDPG